VTEVQLLGRLKQEQAAYALLALQKPNAKDAFEYGHRSGVVAGLELAMSTLLKMVDEENSRDL
jgi:hypothetical protein